MTASQPTLIVLGATTPARLLPRMLNEMHAMTGGGCCVMHVEDAVADMLRIAALPLVAIEPLTTPGLRQEPERVWQPAAAGALQRCIASRAADVVVLYPHREYDPSATFPRLGVECHAAGIQILNGNTGRIVKRDRSDSARGLVSPVATQVQKAITASLKPAVAPPAASLFEEAS